MIDFTGLEVYNSIFKITEGSNNFELSSDVVDEFSITELKAEPEDILDISNITPEPLPDEIIGPHIIKA